MLNANIRVGAEEIDQIGLFVDQLVRVQFELSINAALLSCESF